MGVLDGKVALVTGASRGVGLGIARRFAVEGARVFITGRNEATLEAAAEQIGGRTTGIVGDMANLSDLARVFAEIGSSAGRLDALMANAAVGSTTAFADVTVQDFDTTFDTDTRGVFFTVQKSLPILADDASIVLVSSGAWLKGVPGSSVYAGAKASLRSFARVWASELGGRRIRVNVITLGGIDSGSWERQAPTPEAAEAVKAGVAASTPLGRMGRTDEVAAVALFLAGPESSYINGVELPVDGGLLAV